MLESEKLIQIVQTWLGYIRLEELTQAEVERSSDIYSKVVDKGVQLVGNKLLLDSEVFTQFQQQQQAAKRGNKNKELQQPDCDSEWLTETHPAMQYLWGEPQSPRHEVMFWGAFPDHAPDEFQASVLKHAQENLLTAVCGPLCPSRFEVLIFLLVQSSTSTLHHLEVPNSSQK